MSDSYSDWCDWKEEQARAEYKKEYDKRRGKIDKLRDECLKLQNKAKLRFVECCATCEHQFNSKCGKLGLTYVNDMCVCKFWEPESTGMCSTDDMDSMLFNMVGR